MDRNFLSLRLPTWAATSLSARRAWIEMRNGRDTTRLFSVALRKESVDRNPIAAFLLMWWQVALRKESVDRNPRRQQALNAVNASLSARRAWIEIRALSCRSSAQRWSLSARRAWIEIVYPGTWSGSILSLSARRAWIEIRQYMTG